MHTNGLKVKKDWKLRQDGCQQLICYCAKSTSVPHNDGNKYYESFPHDAEPCGVLPGKRVNLLERSAKWRSCSLAHYCSTHMNCGFPQNQGKPRQGFAAKWRQGKRAVLPVALHMSISAFWNALSQLLFIKLGSDIHIQ